MCLLLWYPNSVLFPTHIFQACSAGFKPAGWLASQLTESLFTSCQNSIFLSQQLARNNIFQSCRTGPSSPPQIKESCISSSTFIVSTNYMFFLCAFVFAHRHHLSKTPRHTQKQVWNNSHAAMQRRC